MSDLHLLLPSPIHILQETITAEAAVVAVTVTAVVAAAVTAIVEAAVTVTAVSVV
jgi:hypothetical protein